MGDYIWDYYTGILRGILGVEILAQIGVFIDHRGA